jgi:hypothetical protein
MRINVILFIVLTLYLVSISQGIFNPGEYKGNIEYIPSKVTDKEQTQSLEQDSSRELLMMPEEAPPVNIIRNIIKPKKDGEFYKDELLEVLIKITTQKKGGLKQIEFWEMPGDDLNISHCSYQIRTSNIHQMLDYEEQDQSLLQKKDIINISAIICSLNTNSSNQPIREKLNNYIYKQLSNDTIELLSDVSENEINESLQEVFKQHLKDDFNKIIENDSTDLAMLFAKCNIKIDWTRVSSLNPDSLAYHDSNDYRLQKRLILEHIYPKMLKNLSFTKEHECQNLVDNKNAIKIIEKDLRQGETIIFKYYLRPTDIGLKEIRCIIRADGYLKEDIDTIRISERGEKFLIRSWSDSNDLISNEKENFTYFIEYLGGSDEKNSFDAIITPPGGCEIDDVSWEDKSKPRFNKNNNGTWSIIHVPFSKGKEETLNFTAEFSETGLRISPPTIKIGAYTERFDPDLAVYADYDSPFRIHFDFLSIFLTIGAIIISLIVAIFSSLEIYLANKEIHLIHAENRIARKQIELAKDEKTELVRILEELTRKINK